MDPRLPTPQTYGDFKRLAREKFESLLAEHASAERWSRVELPVRPDDVSVDEFSPFQKTSLYRVSGTARASAEMLHRVLFSKSYLAEQREIDACLLSREARRHLGASTHALSIMYTRVAAPPGAALERELLTLRYAPPDSKTTLLEFSFNSAETPVAERCVRASLLLCAWLFEPISIRECRVTLFRQYDPCGQVPPESMRRHGLARTLEIFGSLRELAPRIQRRTPCSTLAASVEHAMQAALAIPILSLEDKLALEGCNDVAPRGERPLSARTRDAGALPQRRRSTSALAISDKGALEAYQASLELDHLPFSSSSEEDEAYDSDDAGLGAILGCTRRADVLSIEVASSRHVPSLVVSPRQAPLTLYQASA